MNGNYLLLCLLGISTYLITQTVARESIINGEKAGINQFSYQVSVVILGRNFCGGGIIGEQFIITAAHCVLRTDGLFHGLHMSILAGTNDLYITHPPAVIIDVAKIYVPIEFDATTNNTSGDIAILRLRYPLKLSGYIKKLSLPRNKHENFVGKIGKIAGFGWDYIKIDRGVEIGGGNNDFHLRFAHANVMTNKQCQQGYPRRRIFEQQICAKVQQRSTTKSSGVCGGDSGGPLVHGDQVIGILVASPFRCSERIAGGIYTRVTHYLDFIENAMRDRIINMRTYVMHF